MASHHECLGVRLWVRIRRGRGGVSYGRVRLLNVLHPSLIFPSLSLLAAYLVP